MSLAQLCIEWSVGERIMAERQGVREIRKKAFEDTIDLEFSRLVATEPGRLKLSLFKEVLNGSEPVTNRLRGFMNEIYRLSDAEDTMEIIRTIDSLYNQIADPYFEKRYGDLDTVLAVTLEELTEFSWQDYLNEEALEESFTAYLDRLSENMTNLDQMEQTGQEKEEEQEKTSEKKRILVVDEAALAKMYSYVQRNYGKTYLSETEDKRLNHLLCRGIHSDCSLYFTEGILNNAVLRNYQYEYAKKQKDKNIYAYHNDHRMVKNNIRLLTDMLRKAFIMRIKIKMFS